MAHIDQSRFFQEAHWLKRFYVLVLILMTLTGFGQMPIFKRYYIADIPGLGWLANFYATHYLHYIGAILLLAFCAYMLTAYVLVLRPAYRLTPAAWTRIIILAAIALTGIFRVFKNLPDVTFSPGFTMFIDISHLGFMMLLGIAALGFKLAGALWVVPLQR